LHEWREIPVEPFERGDDVVAGIVAGVDEERQPDGTTCRFMRFAASVELIGQPVNGRR
jgi:hypothetical protein